MSFELDPVRYGVLWNTVENNEKKLEEMNKKMDKLELKIEELIAMAERSKGSLWALMGIASVGGAIISFITDFVFIKKWCMSDPFGLSEGAKTLSGSLNASREASKSLSKSIEGIQQDGIEVAQQKARERIRAKREADLKKEIALVKALEEWKRKKQISDEEANLKIQFVKQYGAKEW